MQAVLHRMPVWKLRTFMLTAPLFVAMIEWPFFGLRLTLLQLLGAGIILAGLLVLILFEARLAAAGTHEPLAVPAPSFPQDETERSKALPV